MLKDSIIRNSKYFMKPDESNVSLRLANGIKSVYQNSSKTHTSKVIKKMMNKFAKINASSKNQF